MDKNIVVLEGIIGDDYKSGKTQDGKVYITFSLCINSHLKEFADSTERTHSQAYIRIFVFDKKQVEYLQGIKAKRGQRAFVFGRLKSVKNEYRGNTFITNNVVCRDVAIIKNKKENNNKDDGNEQQEQELS